MTIDAILKKIYRKFAKDTDYPESGSEDLLVMLDHIDDAISEWEDCVSEGYQWKELITSDTFVFAGSGEDDLPADFLNFQKQFNQSSGFEMARLKIGNAIYTEVKSGEGRQAKTLGQSPYIFWIEGNKICTLPAVSASINLPYLKKATRYTTGEETTEVEMENPKFIEDFALAQLFLDNEDDTLYQKNILSGQDKLSKMKYNALI